MSKKGKSKGEMYVFYEVVIKIRDKICGGIPKAKDVIEKWVGLKIKGAEAQKEVVKETVEAMGDQLTEEKIASMWTGFKKDERGPYIEARQVMALLKESANILKGLKPKSGKGSKPIVNIANFRARLAERVFVEPNRIYLGVGPEEPIVFIERTISVMTSQGPRSAWKRVDYVEQPTITFTLRVLNDELIDKEDLDKVLEHGQNLGIGADRSQGYGKFDLVSIEEIQ